MEQIDLVRTQARQMTAAQIMCSPVETMQEEASLGAAVRLLVNQQRQRLPVVRDGRLVGIVSRHDLLRVIARQELPGAAGESTT